eukprot:875005-Pleurochrysis_carterae.AAC.1
MAAPAAVAAASTARVTEDRRRPRVPVDETAENRAARLASKAAAEHRRRKKVKLVEKAEHDARMAQAAQQASAAPVPAALHHRRALPERIMSAQP